MLFFEDCGFQKKRQHSNHLLKIKVETPAVLVCIMFVCVLLAVGPIPGMLLLYLINTRFPLHVGIMFAVKAAPKRIRELHFCCISPWHQYR